MGDGSHQPRYPPIYPDIVEFKTEEGKGTIWHCSKVEQTACRIMLYHGPETRPGWQEVLVRTAGERHHWTRARYVKRGRECGGTYYEMPPAKRNAPQPPQVWCVRVT
jgi:hypothetical protein